MWAALNDNQKAVLTSLVYNYGHLPESVRVAIGDQKVAAAAISALQSANGGINRKRRIKEATVYLTPVTDLPPAILTHPAGPIVAGTAAVASTGGAIWAHLTCGPCLVGLGFVAGIITSLAIFWFLWERRMKAAAAVPVAITSAPPLSLLDNHKVLLAKRAEIQKEIDISAKALQAYVDESLVQLKTS